MQIGVGFEPADNLLFDNIGNFHFTENSGGKTRLPASILIGNALNSEPCFLKVFKAKNMYYS